MPDAPVALAARGLTIHYDNRPAIQDIDLTIRGGETTSLLGPNGSGKSTLLKALGGMLGPSHGEVRFGSARLTRPHPDITYVPQRAGADWNFPISVLESVMLGLPRTRSRWKPFDRSDRDRAIGALRQTRMDHLAHVQIGALSGGQQQRVFLARALLACGSVLLLDEPFTGVDVPTQEFLIELIDDLRARGTAVVYATHDLAQAAATSNTVVLLNRTIVAAGPPRETLTADALRATFGGAMLFVPTDAPDLVPA
jgi:ABC-type Mn2+/Zn2+ transport system ATPase subunit